MADPANDAKSSAPVKGNSAELTLGPASATGAFKSGIE
jgi:hypothetical protein